MGNLKNASSNTYKAIVELQIIIDSAKSRNCNFDIDDMLTSLDAVLIERQPLLASLVLRDHFQELDQ